jgi:hypothetical protein
MKTEIAGLLFEFQPARSHFNYGTKKSAGYLNVYVLDLIFIIYPLLYQI